MVAGKIERINMDRGIGAFFDIDPDKSRLEGIYLSARDEQEAAIVMGVLARIIKQNCWVWIKGLFNKR